MFRFVLLLCVVALVNGQSTPVKQCIGNSGPLPINAYIEGCTQTPCNLPSMEDAVINITFKAPENINRMRTLATAYVSGILAIPYNLHENAETCNFLTNTNCPVKKDDTVQYALKLYIPPVLPVGIETTFEAEIRDVDRNNSVVCVRVPVRIAPPVNSGDGDNNVNIA